MFVCRFRRRRYFGAGSEPVSPETFRQDQEPVWCSRRSTAISLAGSVDENETVTLRRTKRSTAGRNPNPYNLPRYTALRMTEVSVQQSFGELSEAVSTLGAALSSKLSSMLQTAWMLSEAATANDNHM